MIRKNFIFFIPIIVMVLFYLLGIKVHHEFDIISMLNIELTFYLAIVTIIPLFDFFEKLQKIKVKVFQSKLDMFLGLIVKGFTILFILYFLLSVSFIELNSSCKKFNYGVSVMYNLILYYVYILNLLILFNIIKNFLYSIKNSNLK